jgi:hypothetical protein
VIQREIASTDGMQWHTGGPSNTVDSGQFNTLSYAESVFGDCRVDTSSEGMRWHLSMTVIRSHTT